MKKNFFDILNGYHTFREKYVHDDASILQQLADHGQKPEVMVVSCCDSRVDPALILQCDPGDLFVVRNVANIVPPFEGDHGHHGTSAALEFGINFLQVEHLILLGHSQCGGIQALLSDAEVFKSDFIGSWVELIRSESDLGCSCDDYAKIALQKSYQNTQTFPWILEKIKKGKLKVHLWFFDIKQGEILNFNFQQNQFIPLKIEN